MEIIEIGAVILKEHTFEIISEFSSFVRPIEQPTLSEFCSNLTSIQQEDVDKADDFKVVFKRFLNWIGPDRFTLCSWGNYDLEQFKADCERHKIPFPKSFNQHINLKKEFASQRKIKRCGMMKALNILQIAHEGKHHRAIDDARNIAKTAKIILASSTQ